MDPNGNDVIISITNSQHAQAFNKFMSTKMGRAFIRQYAAAGQQIGGYTFKTAGKFSNMNLSINSKNLTGKYASSAAFLTNSPKGKIRLRNMMSSKDLPVGKRKYELQINLANGVSDEQAAYSLGHEAFVHTENTTEAINDVENDAKTGKIDSELKLVGKLSSVEMTANEEHNDFVTEGTDENLKMNNYVNQLNNQENTNKYTKLLKDDQKKYK